MGGRGNEAIEYCRFIDGVCGRCGYVLRGRAATLATPPLRVCEITEHIAAELCKSCAEFEPRGPACSLEIDGVTACDLRRAWILRVKRGCRANKSGPGAV